MNGVQKTCGCNFIFESKRELLLIILDIVICELTRIQAFPIYLHNLGLRDLYEDAHILHRDISIYNIMIGRDRNGDGYWKGLLIDYDYALDLLRKQ